MNRLQEAEVELIDRRTCNLMSWYNGLITENMICAGLESGAADACQVIIFVRFVRAGHRFHFNKKAICLCVCLRVTVGVLCSATARMRRASMWSE